MIIGVYRRLGQLACKTLVLLSLGSLSAVLAFAQTVPATNLDPASATITLDSSFQDDAWLVYTYDIDAEGSVVNARIRLSNGVPPLEEALLSQVRSMRFEPATRAGKPVKFSANPVVYTWILDKKREMGPDFSNLYRQAWDHFSAEDYAAAQAIAEQLAVYPGRSALEEVKSRTLAASLANRSGDAAAELRHLNRIVDFQSLALNNNFNNVYVPSEQYLKMLDRILTLQLDGNMLADAGVTLDLLQSLARGEPLVQSAAERYVVAEQALQRMDDVAIEGELRALYPGGPANWTMGLSKKELYLADVTGNVGSVYLVCNAGERRMTWPSKEHWRVPAGWSECEIEVSGKHGTRFRLHQAGGG